MRAQGLARGLALCALLASIAGTGAAAGGIWHACTFEDLPPVVLHYPAGDGQITLSAGNRPAVPARESGALALSATVDGYSFRVSPSAATVEIARAGNLVAEATGRCARVGGPARQEQLVIGPPPAGGAGTALPAARPAAPPRLAAPAPAPVRAAPVTRGAWDVSTDRSAFDDSTSVFLMLGSETMVADQFGRGRGPAYLALRCLENTTSAFLTLNDQFLADVQSYGRVDYRIDRARAKSVNMQASTDNKALGLWRGSRAIPFLKELMPGEKLVLRVTPFNESPVEVEFSLTGLDEAIKPLREACRW